MNRFLILMLLTTSSVMAQSVDSTTTPTIPPKSSYKFGWSAEIGITYAITSLPNVRSFFESNRIKSQGSLEPFIHFGVSARYQRLKLTAQVGINYSHLNVPRDEDSVVARLVKAGYTGLLIGFDVVNGRNRRLYINAGVGGIGYEYSVYRRTRQAVAAQSLPQYSQPGNVPSLFLNNGYWDVNLDYVLREKRPLSFLTAVRIGYRRALQREVWQSDAFQLIGGPSDRISQFYFQTVFGFSTNYLKNSQR
ncbi:hypothetical protein ACFQ4C_04290 [Larkinella insperata]|uniref:Outer membrane protein beta-barrel domain-containing protein n=1 Tax=Larkinella insperata TaxID=332158 RepID=A0ABW3Q6X5_9BACT|nr:hypothetical protein [Larkinella insperata]